MSDKEWIHGSIVPLAASAVAVGVGVALYYWRGQHVKTVPPTTQQLLGDRMKDYEREFESTLDPSKPFVARLDGHAFSKFTSGLQQPFDRRFTLAMIMTMDDLLRQFQARTGYCQSDEITLVFVPTATETGTFRPYDFTGRVMKLSTLMSGFASARFQFHMRSIIADPSYGADVAVQAGGGAHIVRDITDEKVFSCLQNFPLCITSPLTALFVIVIAREIHQSTSQSPF
jgi:hypothetical protein